MELFKIIKVLGITVYALLAVTVFSGLKRWPLKRHRTLAFLALALATAHGLIVFLFS